MYEILTYVFAVGFLVLGAISIANHHDWQHRMRKADYFVFLYQYELALKSQKIAALNGIDAIGVYKIFYKEFMEAYETHKSNPLVKEYCEEIKKNVDAEITRITDIEQKQRVESFLRKD